MAAVGNLNDYVKFQMAEGMAKGGGGGVGGIGRGDGRGLGDGAADDEPARRHHGAGDAGHRAAAGRGGRRRALRRELLSPRRSAQALGVSEADVIATLEAGDLKGKKIGTQWRITRAALDEFLKS